MTENPEYVPEHRAETDEPIIGDPPPRQHTLLSNRAYDVLKFVALVVLPSLGSAYFILAGMWDLPKTDEVVGTIVVLDTFLGAFLGISSSKYVDPRDGKMVGFIDISKTPTGKKFDLQYPGDPNEILSQDKVTFKVRDKT